MRGEYVLNTLFRLELVWNSHGTGMERTPRTTSVLRYYIFWSGMEWSGTEFDPCSGSLDRGLDRGVSFPSFRTNHNER